MAGSSRFPHLAVPFTLIGAAAGWLSAGLFENPALVRVKVAPQIAVTLLAAAIAGLTGALLTRLCVGGPYRYQLDEPYPVMRQPADRWMNHSFAVLGAGVLTGALASFLFDAYHGWALASLGGLACAAAFLPVCLAVLGAARRAQRARLGLLVEASDRRAVWGILATALSAMTLGALPSWAAAVAGDVPSQLPVVGMLAVSGLGIAGILVADVGSLWRARQGLSPDLVTKEASDICVERHGDSPPRFGARRRSPAARVARPSSAYRGRDKALALIVAILDWPSPRCGGRSGGAPSSGSPSWQARGRSTWRPIRSLRDWSSTRGNVTRLISFKGVRARRGPPPGGKHM